MLPSRPMGMSVLPGMATETPTEFGGFATKPKSAAQLKAEEESAKAADAQARLEQFIAKLTPEQARQFDIAQATRGMNLPGPVLQSMMGMTPEEKPAPAMNMSQLEAAVASGTATPEQTKAYWEFQRRTEALKPPGAGAERKPPPPAQVNTMLEFRDGWSQLENLKSMWPVDTKSPNYLEQRLPVEMLAEMPNWIVRNTGIGADTKARNAVISIARQVIGKALEGGVLRKEDELKYQKMLPNLTDPASVAKSKLDTVQAMLQDRYDERLRYLEDTGYNVRGLTTVRPQSGFEDYSPADVEFLNKWLKRRGQ